MTKQFINNRDGNRICVVVEGDENTGKLAFVAHGLGGSKQEPHILAMIAAFLENGYRVVSFDAVHTFGESTGGSFEDATVTNYLADLEDVIDWAATQDWYVEPFVLCGHSLGGISVALYAENHPEKVKALAPISLVVSGKLSFESHALFPNDIESLDDWKRDGIRITKSHDGKREKRLKWSHMEDRLKYDTLLKIDKLTMPTIVMVGEKDIRTPAVHQKIFFDHLPGKKEMYVIPNALHSFYESDEREILKSYLSKWLKTIK